MYPSNKISRRQLLKSSATYAAATLAVPTIENAQEKSPGNENKVQLSQIHGQSEQDEKAPGPYLSLDKRVGSAINGLGRLSIDQILPAFGSSRYSRPVALVSVTEARRRSLLNNMVFPNRQSTTTRTTNSFPQIRRYRPSTLCYQTVSTKNT